MPDMPNDWTTPSEGPAGGGVNDWITPEESAPTGREIATDIAKQAAAGIVTGSEARMGAIPSLIGAAGWGFEKYVQPYLPSWAQSDPGALAQREQLQKLIAQQRGGGISQYLPEPETEYGAAARRVAELGAGGAGAPGGVAAGLAAGATSEAAGQASRATFPEAEPYARAVGGVVGGMRGIRAIDEAQNLAAIKNLVHEDAPTGTKALYRNFDAVAQGQPVDWKIMFNLKSQMRNALQQLPYDTEVGTRLVDKLAARDVADLNKWRQGMRETLFKKGEGQSAQALTGLVDDAIDRSLPTGGPGVGLLQEADRQFAIKSLMTDLENRFKMTGQETEATHSGANLDNKIRQALVSFQNNQRAWHGLTPQERVMVEQIIRGGVGVNFLRRASNFLGGGGGLGSFVTAALLSSIVGPHVGVPTALAGLAMKRMENTATRTAAQNLLGTIGERSAFGQGKRLTSLPFGQRAWGGLYYGGIAGQ